LDVHPGQDAPVGKIAPPLSATRRTFDENRGANGLMLILPNDPDAPAIRFLFVTDVTDDEVFDLLDSSARLVCLDEFEAAAAAELDAPDRPTTFREFEDALAELDLGSTDEQEYLPPVSSWRAARRTLLDRYESRGEAS